MLAKQSSIALGIHSRSGPFTAPPPTPAVALVVPLAVAIRGAAPHRGGMSNQSVTSNRGMTPMRAAKTLQGAARGPRDMREAIFGGGHGASGVQSSGRSAGWSLRSFERRLGQPAGGETPQTGVALDGVALDGAAVAQGEGLLHDTRNLLSALGLYSDLLSVPGVLKPEHRHYAEELRLMGSRSAALMGRLMVCSSGMAGRPAGLPSGLPSVLPFGQERMTQDCGAAGAEAAGGAFSTDRSGAEWAGAGPVSVRSIVERCSGLLGQVAEGRTIEVIYGPAASVPVLVDEESVERILMNLVHNSAAALDGRGTAREETPGAIRIGVGLLTGRVGDPSPWPFRRVRLTVEDSGCGMAPEQIERLLESGRTGGRSSREIGFRVVRELVAASDGNLRLMSAPGVGTRVQIEWPVAARTGAPSGPAGAWGKAQVAGREAQASGPPGAQGLGPSPRASEASGAGLGRAGDERWTA